MYCINTCLSYLWVVGTPSGIMLILHNIVRCHHIHIRSMLPIWLPLSISSFLFLSLFLFPLTFSSLLLKKIDVWRRRDSNPRLMHDELDHRTTVSCQNQITLKWSNSQNVPRRLDFFYWALNLLMEFFVQDFFMFQLHFREK